MKRRCVGIAVGLLWLSALFGAFTVSPVLAAAETVAAQEEQLGDSWFDDAVFIGDSIAGTLQLYAEQHSRLGAALFFCRTNYSLAAAVNGSMLLYYRGSGYPLKELLPRTGANKVFILLGMNDIGEDDSDYAALWSALVDDIRESAPDMRIFFQTVTPIARPLPNNALTNARIDRYNERLREFCEDNGCCCVDVANSFKDSTGALCAELCRDGYDHLILDAGERWCEALQDPVNYSLDPLGSRNSESAQ